MKLSAPSPLSQPAPAVNPWLVLAVVTLGNLTSSILGSSVNVLLPLIRSEYQVSLGAIEWTLTAYLLTSASFLIFFGRLGDMVGHKRVYVSGFLLFTSGSLACGLAPGLPYLLAGRILQALGAAMLWAISAALITAAFPPEKRGQALGLQAAGVYVGLTLGPTFGGLVAGWLGWQWVFLLMVLPSALCAFMSGSFLPNPRRGKREGFDPAGALLFAAALSALLVSLSKGGEWGWNSAITLGVMALAVVASGLFIWVEGRVPSPMFPLSMFQSVTFSSGISAAFVNYAMGSMLTFLLPFYLVELRGFNTSDAGVIMSAQAAAMVPVAMLSGWASDRFGSRGLAAVGLGLQGIALLLMSQLGPASPLVAIAGVQAVMGVGVGLFTTPNNSAIMGAAARDRQGVAAGMLAAARTVGMVVGVAVAGATFRGLQMTYLAAGRGDSEAFLGAMSGALYAGAALAALGVILTLLRGKPQSAK